MTAYSHSAMTNNMNISKRSTVIEITTPGVVPDDIYSATEPLVLKGLIKNWKLVEAGLTSDTRAIEYLKSHYNGNLSIVCFGKPEIKGRLFYNEDATKLNYESRRARIDDTLDLILETIADPEPSTYYIASNHVDTHFQPCLREENDLVFTRIPDDPDIPPPLASIWIGSPTIASCHYDAPNNIACCVVGKRRFTLFPPEQIHNLYPGPLEPTPGGQAISMVDFKNPDLKKYPRFKHAIAAAQIAELEPGDALYLPPMWWHHVEALSPFNILVNYWWSYSPAYMGTPMNVLKHALLSLRDRPEYEKQAWKHIFDYYVFGSSERAGKHLSTAARGELAPIDEITARKLRAYLINKLNR